MLEAGAGTGGATLELARRRASVVAVEPDGAVAAVARQRTPGMTVDVRESTFEDCTVATGHVRSLIVAAQACGRPKSTLVSGPRVTSEDHAEVKRRKREVAELRRANETCSRLLGFRRGRTRPATARE